MPITLPAHGERIASAVHTLANRPSRPRPATCKSSCYTPSQPAAMAKREPAFFRLAAEFARSHDTKALLPGETADGFIGNA